ncbi:MAG: hypothetical protein U1A78_39630 [Polyangia bacterium]
MPVDFSKLLDSQRLRPLWGKDPPPPERPASPPTGAPRAVPAADDDQEAAGSHLAIESPAAVLQALETTLSTQAGPAAGLLVHILMPLRSGISRLDPTALPVPPHPLQRASPVGPIGTVGTVGTVALGGPPGSQGLLSLIDQMDDILGVLLRQPR